MTIFSSLLRLWRGPEAPVAAPLAQTIADPFVMKPIPKDSDAAKAHAFLDGLRAENRSGSATFGSITAGRAVFPPPSKTTPRAPVIADGGLDGKDLLKYMR